MKLTRITSDDWEGLYLDDKLINQAHAIDVIYTLRRYIKNNGSIVLDEVVSHPADEDWMKDRSDLPESLREVETWTP